MSSLFKPTVVQTPAPAATVAAPVVTPPATMPDTSSAGVREAARREQNAIMNRAGRQSTILTSPNNRGSSRQNYDSYASRTLGGAT